MAIWHVLWLGSLDLTIGDLLEGCSCFLCSRLNLVFRGTVQGTVLVVKVLAMGERDQIFELGLDDFAWPLALVCDGVVPNIAFTVDLKCECVTGRALKRCQTISMAATTIFHLFPTHVERELCYVAFRI